MKKGREVFYLILSLLGALIVIGGVIGLGAYFTYPINTFLCAGIIFIGLFLLAICSFYIIRSYSRLTTKKKKQSEFSLYEFETDEEKLMTKLKSYKSEKITLKENEYEVYTLGENQSLNISYILARDLKNKDIDYISNDLKSLVDRCQLGLVNVIISCDEYEENFINNRDIILRGILVTYVDKKNMAHLNVYDKVESYDPTQMLSLDIRNKFEDR